MVAFMEHLRSALKGQTQAELARKLGVSQQAISDQLNGKAFPRWRALPRYARVLGVPHDSLRRAIAQDRAARHAHLSTESTP